MINLKNKADWTSKIDKIIFVFASLYLITTLGWLWKQQQSEILANSIVTQENSTTKDDTASNDNQQLDNNQSSSKQLQPLIPLPTINEKPNTTITKDNSSNLVTVPEKTNTTAINIIPPPLPPQQIANTPVENSAPVEIIVEEKPPVQVVKNKLPIPIPIQTSSTPPPQTKTSSTPPANIQKGEITAEKTSTSKTVSTPKILTQVPTIKSLKSSVEQESVNNQQQSINNVVSESNSENLTTSNFKQIDYQYSLLGVVQLPNEQSFALFKIDDLTEKVPVGMEIGTSGWVLMSVNGTQATITRQNESLNIRVGETF